MAATTATELLTGRQVTVIQIWMTTVFLSILYFKLKESVPKYASFISVLLLLSTASMASSLVQLMVATSCGAEATHKRKRLLQQKGILTR